LLDGRGLRTLGELARNPQAWQGRISDQGQTFAREVIDDGQDAEAAPSVIASDGKSRVQR